MTEEMGDQKSRIVVRGSCISYHMPWEDILENLKKNCADRNLTEIPHPQETLKYMLRVHLQVAGVDFQKHLKQVMVRPFVLIHLLDFLIDRNHEVFRGKGSPAELRERMRTAVRREYPEIEDGPEEERVGTVPPSILQLLREVEEGKETNADVSDRAPLLPPSRRRRLLTEKNATPGDGARALETCLEDLRPYAMCLDKSVQACSDPATLREGALERYGELHVRTGGKEILQFHSKYFSQILPFVIPFMVSGPDFFPDKRWEKKT